MGIIMQLTPLSELDCSKWPGSSMERWALMHWVLEHSFGYDIPFERQDAVGVFLYHSHGARCTQRQAQNSYELLRAKGLIRRYKPCA